MIAVTRTQMMRARVRVKVTVLRDGEGEDEENKNEDGIEGECMLIHAMTNMKVTVVIDQKK